MHEITLILEAAQRGEPDAAERLMDTVYAELRALAGAKMAGEHANVTLQPTALVHEAWLRLGGDAQPAWQNRAHFFAAAAEAMRRILIDRARRRNRVRHGSGQRPVDVDGMHELAGEAVDTDGRLLAVDEALERFAAAEPERAQLVKLRYFVGLTIEDAAKVLGISESTAKRWWVFARAWLYREIAHD
jgi:RNA polymerase sigma factor (TIGR02999 family)